jgi:Tol biopolymer transport system component
VLLLFAQPALATSVTPGGQLVWETHNGFVLTNPLGRGATVLPALPASVQPWRVALSPSGSTLMIESDSRTSEPPGMNLFLLNLNTGRTRLFAQFPPSGGADYLNGVGAFSPDSRALAYGFSPSATGGAGVVFMSVANGHRIRSINIPGGETVPVFQWLPDGRLLVQSANGLETVSKTGTGARPININLQGYTQINTAVASPDGSEVAMQVDTGQGCGQEGPCNSAVYIVPTAGGTAIRLASAESDSEPVWSPDGKFLIYDQSATTTRLMTVATRHTITIRPLSGWAEIVGWRSAPPA